ncbi:MAG: DUF4331 domain-containing protein [Acidimicrobiia bacterium]
MSSVRNEAPKVLLALGLTAVLALALLAPVGASSHREAPLITEDPVADNTDVYAFMDPSDPNKVTIIANWIPLEEPAGGPNFFKFGDDVLYEINIDNNGDAVDDIAYEFRFRTTLRNPNTFLYNTGPITSLDDPDWNVVQTYTVSEMRGGRRTVLGENLLTPPVNIGPRSTPDYESLAAEAVRTVRRGIEVFAGQRDEVFPVDLGSLFDLGGLRPFNPAHVIPLPAEPGIDTTTGYNVHTIAMRIPTGQLVRGGDPVIGIRSTTYRRAGRVFEGGDGANLVHSGPWVQVSRLGNPLVNEVVIPLGNKDRFNASQPADDGQFLDFVVDPELGALIPVLYPGVQVPGEPRNDLVTIFLTGIPGLNQPAGVTPSEMLRLNTSVSPSGFPNGRTLQDDVVDIALRAVAGIFCDSQSGDPEDGCEGFTLAGSPFNVFPNNALEDGASGNDLPFLAQFPYMPTPHAGYDHVHDHSNTG